MTPKSRCRIDAKALGENVDGNYLFREEDDRRRAELDALLADHDPHAEGWRQRKAAQKQRPRPNLDALIATQRPGHCCICDEPLPPLSRSGGMPRRTCGKQECHRKHQNALKRDHQLRELAEAEKAGTP